MCQSANKILIINPSFQHHKILFTFHYPQNGLFAEDGELPSDCQAAKPIEMLMQTKQLNFQIPGLAQEPDLFWEFDD